MYQALMPTGYMLHKNGNDQVKVRDAAHKLKASECDAAHKGRDLKVMLLTNESYLDCHDEIEETT